MVLDLELEAQLENGMRKLNWKERTNALARHRVTNSICTARKAYLKLFPSHINLLSCSLTREKSEYILVLVQVLVVILTQA
jgi:hypothetical protein